MEARIRVLLCEDHAMVRAGLRMVLQEAGVDVIGEAGTGREGVELVRARRPDVVLMDLSMPDMDGYQATAEIVREFPEVRVLIVTMHADEAYVTRALQCGAHGYIPKGATGDELTRAIRAVVDGKRHVVLAEDQDPDVPDDVRSRYARLTPRQREVLQLVAEGLRTRDIAERLGISVKTVEAHRTNIMQRLDVHELAGVVRFAVRAGIVAP